ncbi:MAG: glycine cleavage system aminomethyltransferase GcvT [Proteobacteria bacterium]|nr:glycine cleavage system aminomethyltransferase GcvT [Pseudomonadota bacterium]
MGEPSLASLKRTPLHELHVELGARLVPFAGYEMPVQYEGIIAEHAATRQGAGLFDVSHMGQARIVGAGAAEALERLVPGNIVELKPGRQRYTVFTNAQGGILDDLMVTNLGEALFLVVNAACKEQDFAHLRANLSGGVHLEEMPERALVALQGPRAAAVMGCLSPGADRMAFMSRSALRVAGIACEATRSGYTGEDGFEISVVAAKAVALARALLAEPGVKPVGLGARDSLRLEAGLCLYGSDIDTTTTPVEADLSWTIAKRRREGGGFPGAEIIRRQLAEGAPRLRVGILPEGRQPARAHTEVFSAAGERIGEVTSGGFGPTLGRPIAMGYVRRDFAAAGTELRLVVRGKEMPAKVVPMPFVPHRYHRG